MTHPTCARSSSFWAIIIIGLIAYGACVTWIDIPLAKWIAINWQTLGLVRAATWVSAIFNTRYWFLLASLALLTVLITAAIKKINTPCRTAWAQFGLALWLTIILVDILKQIIGRARPYLLLTHHISGFFPFASQRAYFSSPSGHVTIAAFVTCCVFASTKNIIWRVIFVALLIAAMLSRMILLQHFLGDTILSVVVVTAVFPYRSCMLSVLKRMIGRGE